jgi:4-amino-4-deoxy-L-arabinose transferase-like glycosyltransferase
MPAVQTLVRKGFVIWILFALFVGMRLVHLSADPPDNLRVESASEYGDPGNYAFNARSKVVLGDWKIDELGAAAVAPVPNALTYLIFRLFGVGLGAMNLVPLIFSMLLWGALYVLATKYFPDARLLFFVLLAANYLFGVYSRINNQIMPMTLFVVLAMIFFLKAWAKPAHFFTTGVFLALAFVSKAKIIYFHAAVLPVAALLILALRGELKKLKLNLVRLGYFAGGALLLAIPWFFGIYLRYHTVFQNVGGLNAEAMFPQGLGQALGYWVNRKPFSFYPDNILLAVAVFFYLIVLLVTVFNKKTKDRIAPLEILCSTWLVVGLTVHAFIGYRPIRHYIEFTVPFIILAAIFLTRLRAGLRLEALFRKKAGLFTSLFVLVWAAISSLTLRIFSREDIATRKERILLFMLLMGLAFAGLLFSILKRRLEGRGLFVSPRAGTILIAVFLAVYGYQNLADYAFWIRNAAYNLKTIGRDLGRAFPDGVFSGLLVPSLSLENRNAAHTLAPSYANNDPAFLQREGVTHLFLGTFNNERRHYDNLFPEVMERARLLAAYRMWRSWWLLYDLRQDLPPEDAAVHEAETMERETGIPRFDPRAGGRFAVRFASANRQIIGRKRISLQDTGPVQGRVFVKAEGNEPQGLRIYVTLSLRGRIVFKKRLDVLEAGASPDYLALPFKARIETKGSYILEVKAVGAGAFWFDKIELRPKS